MVVTDVGIHIVKWVGTWRHYGPRRRRRSAQTTWRPYARGQVKLLVQRVLLYVGLRQRCENEMVTEVWESLSQRDRRRVAGESARRWRPSRREIRLLSSD